jgi:hypothetical protein
LAQYTIPHRVYLFRELLRGDDMTIVTHNVIARLGSVVDGSLQVQLKRDNRSQMSSQWRSKHRLTLYTNLLLAPGKLDISDWRRAAVAKPCIANTHTTFESRIGIKMYPKALELLQP